MAQFIAAARLAKTHDPHLPHGEHDLAMLSRAVPYAQSIVLCGDPLDHTQDPEAFIGSEEER